MGLSRILFETQNLTTPNFWAASDEGDLVLIDWSIKPASLDSDGKSPEFVRQTYDSERNYRPVWSLEKSPFYPDTLLTVHDFHFAIWRTSLGEEQRTPIFRSRNTKGSSNTGGAFSPTRPGVIFITKTDGIDVWDFIDQSDKPSLSLAIAPITVTFFQFHNIKETSKRSKQYLAYGDDSEGTLYLYNVPHNLKQPQDNEEKTIRDFWNKEIEKCNFVRARKVSMREEYQANERAEEIKKAIAEQQKDMLESAEAEREQAEEDAYQDKLLVEKARLGLITDEELEAIRQDKKKKRAQV